VNVYNRGKKIMSDGSTDWTSADIRVLLVTSGYVFDELHNTVSQITNELSGDGYARVTLNSRTATQDNNAFRVVFDGDDAAFPTLGPGAGTPAAAIIYKFNALDALAELISYDLLVAPSVPDGGTYTIVWNADGILFLTSAVSGLSSLGTQPALSVLVRDANTAGVISAKAFSAGSFVKVKADGTGFEDGVAVPSGIDRCDATLLTGSDEFLTSSLDAAWTVTDGTPGVVDPLNPVARNYAITPRVFAQNPAGGLRAAGYGGFGVGGNSPWFTRSVGTLADGESLTFGLCLPPMSSTGFVLCGIQNATDKSGTGFASMLYLPNTTAGAWGGTITAGAGFSTAVSSACATSVGGNAAIWFKRVGSTVYVGISSVDGNDWASINYSFAYDAGDTHLVFGVGSNAGAPAWVPRLKWVRHTVTASDGLSPWELS